MLFNQTFNPSFQPYEFLDAVPKVLAESAVALANPSVKVLDALHAVAFRNGLGNSLFATDAALRNLTRADLQAFAAQRFTANNITVVGRGVVHDELAELVEESLQNVSIPSASAASAAVPATQYFGGEARIDAGPKGIAHYAVAFKSTPESPVSRVLSALLGGAQHVKWSDASSGQTATLSTAATRTTSVSSLSASYSDAGLVGFYVRGVAGEVKGCAKKAVDAIRSIGSGKVSSEALARAKKAAKVAYADLYDGIGAQGSVPLMGAQVLSTGGVKNMTEVFNEIDKVTSEDVVKVSLMGCVF